MRSVLSGLLIFSLLATALHAAEEEGQEESQPLDRDFRETALYYHNFYRNQRGLEPLRLDERMNILAHDHAERLSREKKLKTSGTYLQNLWSYRGTLHELSWSAEYSVKSWYEGNSTIINTISLVDEKTLYSGGIHFLGFGVGAFSNYTVAVAYYA